MNKLSKFLIAILFVFILGAASFLSYVLLTQPGSTSFLKYFIKKKWDIDYVEPIQGSGSIAQGLELENIEFNNMDWLPPDMFLRIQKLNVKFSTLGWRQAEAHIENARLSKPQGNPIVLSGYYNQGEFRLNIFSTGINVNDLEFFLVRFGFEKYKLYVEKGKLGAFDLTLEGDIDHFRVHGEIYLEEYVYKDFTVTDGPFKINVSFKKQDEKYISEGEIFLESGVLVVRKTTIQLNTSRLLFSSQDEWPQLLARGESTIGETKINIYVKGPVNKPNLDLSSDPPFSQDKLLLMLATNKSWNSLDNSLVQQKLSTQALGDVIDYFVLGGSGSGLAKKLGIKDVWFDTDKDRNAVGIKKEILSTLDVGYELEQKKDPRLPTRTQHKVLGDVDLNKHITFSIEKELREEREAEDINEPLVPEDKVFLKYKTSF